MKLAAVLVSLLLAAAAPQLHAAAPPEVLQNIGKDCWEACNNRSGLCSFCGEGNACCRKNTTTPQPEECSAIPVFYTWHHECVAPVVQVTPFRAAVDGGKAAANIALAEGLTNKEQVNAAGDAAAEAAVRAGIPERASEAAASATVLASLEAYSHLNFKATSAAQAALSEATKAAQGSATDSAAIAIAAQNGIVDAIARSGQNAGDLVKDAGKDVTQQMTAAAEQALKVASEMGVTINQTAQAANQAALDVASSNGLLGEAAQSIATDVIASAKEKTLVVLSSKGDLREPLEHAFTNCWERCFSQPGLCDGFCGKGNSCCRKSGGIVVPKECEDIHRYFTPHYECVETKYQNLPQEYKDREAAVAVVPEAAPAAPVPAAEAPVPAPEDAETDDAADPPVNDAPEAQAEVEAPAAERSIFSTAEYVSMAVAVAISSAAAAIGFYLSWRTERDRGYQKAATTRGITLDDSPAAAGDLEFQLQPLTGAQFSQMPMMTTGVPMMGGAMPATQYYQPSYYYGGEPTVSYSPSYGQ